MTSPEPHAPRSAAPRGDRKDIKVQLRLRAAQKDVLTRAAHLKHTTLSAFVVEHALGAAQQVLAEQVNFSLSPERWEAFRVALDAPPKDIRALRTFLAEPSIFDDAGRHPTR